jgi:hypothetical protein
MEALQKQIIILSNKIDAIYVLLEQLDRKVSNCTGEKETTDRDSFLLELKKAENTNFNDIIIDPSLEHKDVLIDDNYRPKSDRCIENSELTADIQIQRLTAQLTAAYHRIAALEDQLLSKRINS